MPTSKPRSCGESSVDVSGHAFEVLRGRLLPYHHDGRGTVRSVVPSDPLKLCVEVIKRAVIYGESGSQLIIGHAASGKSTLVAVAISEVLTLEGGVDPEDGESPFSLVTLFCSTLDDDLSALRSITRQLRLENVVGDKVFGSVSENLSFLLEALRGGKRQETRPVVFVLDQVEALCEKGKQTLLYNLLDCTQIAGTPICIVGMTRRYDVLDLMEKRVRSRFSQRVIQLFPRHTVPQFIDISKRLLTIDRQSFSSKKFSKKEQEVEEFISAWNPAVVVFLESDVAQDAIKAIFSRSPNFRALKAFLFTLISQSSVQDELNAEGDRITKISNAMKSSASRAFGTAMGEGVGTLGQCGCDLAHLPTLELTLLIAGRRQTLIDAAKTFNFYTLFRDYKRFAKENPSISNFDRSVVRKAFENLVDEGFFLPSGGRDKLSKEKGVCKDFQEFLLSWGEEELAKHLKVYPSLPTALQRWMSAPAVADYYG